MIKKLHLEGKVVSITRVDAEKVTEDIMPGCTLRAINKVLDGEKIVISEENCRCRGGNAGFGLKDGLPNIPGGFGHFMSEGRGEGYPDGERIKMNPEIGEQMILNQPVDVMDGHNAIELKPYDGSTCDTVTILVTPDQLSALIHVFTFRKTGYDDVIAPMSSGCASIFRIPFGELKKDHPRAVIGNVDVFSRPHYDKNTFFLTVSGKDFEQMLEDSKYSVLEAPIFKKVAGRLAD